MSDKDDALDARGVPPRGTPLSFSRLALGAAAGSAAGAAAFAGIAGTLPAPGTDTPVPWAGAALLGAAAGLLLVARGGEADSAGRAGTRASRADDAFALPVLPLQVVSGGSRTAVEAAVVELAARFLARGERVLVIDGGRRLALHEWVGASPRLGLVECLAGTLPLLGLVQCGGPPGLYVLSHGAPTTEERWSQLDHLLEQAWPHFGRVVLVLDSAAHGSVGDALRGRLLRAWWAGGSGALPRTALALSQRLGIWFVRIDLGARANVTLEGLEERVRELEALLPAPAPEPAPLVLPAPEAPAFAAASAPEVLACNLQVRERLRFLIWMRGLQAESRRAALVPALQG